MGHRIGERHGGWVKGGGEENLTKDTPPLFVWYVFQPPQVAVLCFARGGKDPHPQDP